MAEYYSKHTGETIDNALDIALGLNEITEEEIDAICNNDLIEEVLTESQIENLYNKIDNSATTTSLAEEV